MAPFLPGLPVLPPVALRKHPLPSPVGRGVRVLSIKSVRQLYTTPPLFEILPVQVPYVDEVFTQ